MISTDGKDPVIIVSGPLRSGTPMMCMLDAADVSIIANHPRESKIDKPSGYFEFEPVQRM